MTDSEKVAALLVQIRQGELVSGVLSMPGDNAGLRKIDIRPIEIKGKMAYQLTEHYAQKVMHRNMPFQACEDFVRGCFPGKFRQGIFTTVGFSYHLLVGKKEQISVVRKVVKPPAEIPLVHNRPKKHLLPEGEPISFLVSLGIMNEAGQVYPKKYDKFRQINRFVEMVRDVLDHLPADKPLRVIDFGCGKSYLTFALYHYLHEVLKREVHITGLDLKKDVIERCQALANEVGYQNLSFSVGDISAYQLEGNIDLVISLHACDTATDAALEKAVKWEAKVILCVPCCQHELYKQIQNEALDTLLRHGILRERFAALATDAARAELLTSVGYEVQILEFIDMEHTPKNLLIRAVKAPSSSRQKEAAKRYERFKSALQINPSLNLVSILK